LFHADQQAKKGLEELEARKNSKIAVPEAKGKAAGNGSSFQQVQSTMDKTTSQMV
jgi:hypothetical protein